MELRPYQVNAINSVKQEWLTRDKTLLVLATGTGKTVCFGKIAHDIVESGGKPLILAHREELLQQAKDKLLKQFDVTCDVKSVQGMALDKNLDTYDSNHFSHIIVDEAHHVMSDSYLKVLNHFNAKVLGVTATPDRADKKNLGKYFESIAYEYSMANAIKDGYLCKLVAHMIPLQIDISKVSIQGGDYNANESASAIEPYLEEIADEIVKNYANRKIMIFLPLVSTSQKMAQILTDKGLAAKEVNGNSKDREQILEEFAQNKFRIICNSMLLTEGYDCPDVDCVCCLRPTKSRAMYQQIIGRGTRLAPNKNECIVLDFLWNTEKHSLCRPSNLVAKSEDIASKINKKAETEVIDLLEAEEEAEREVIAEREESLAKELRSQRYKKKGAVDPIQFAFSINVEDLVNYEPQMMWEMSPPTDKQLKTLTNFGIDVTNIRNCGMASVLLDKCFARVKEGMSTAKQIRFLESRGFKNVGTWTNNEASNMITTIANNHWYVPYGINAAEYVPNRGNK